MVLKKMIKKTAPFPLKNTPLNHQFYPHLVQAHSEKYYTSDLSELYMTPYC